MKHISPITGLFAAALLAGTTAGPAAAQAARDYISIVGSSTVYPFSTVVAEQFGKTSKFKTPKVESTGSGGGSATSGQGRSSGIQRFSRAVRRVVVRAVSGKSASYLT